MKNKILAILAILLVALSGVSINAMPVSAAVTANTLDFGEIVIGQGKTMNLVVSGPAGSTFSVTGFTRGTYSEKIDVTFPSGTITINESGSTSVPITILAKEGQFINFAGNTEFKFGGKLAITDSTNSKTDVEIETNVFSDAVDLDLDDDDFDEDLEPGDSISSSIDVDNLLDEEIELDDIEITIPDLEAGDDLEFSLDDIQDIDSNDNDEFDVDIDVPYNVDEGDYSIEARLDFDGADSNDNYKVNAVWVSAFEVKKDENRDVEFTTLSLNQENPACGAIINVDVEVVNTGEDDLDNTVIVASVDDTELSERSSSFDLDSNAAEDSENRVSLNLRLPQDLDAGEYTLRVKAYYKDTIFIEEKTLSFVVRCGADSGSSDDDQDEEDQQDDEVIDRNPVTGGSTVYTPSSPFGSLFGSSNAGTVIFWVIVDLILLLIAIWLLRVIFRRRKND